MSQTADTQDKHRRETRRDRIATAVRESVFQHGHADALHIADAVIAAYAEPHVPKEKNRPKGPNDHCTLFALRHELKTLCRLVASLPDGSEHEYPGAFALAGALKDQGVVE